MLTFNPVSYVVSLTSKLICLFAFIYTFILLLEESFPSNKTCSLFTNSSIIKSNDIARDATAFILYFIPLPYPEKEDISLLFLV